MKQICAILILIEVDDMFVHNMRPGWYRVAVCPSCYGLSGFGRIGPRTIGPPDSWAPGPNCPGHLPHCPFLGEDYDEHHEHIDIRGCPVASGLGNLTILRQPKWFFFDPLFAGPPLSHNDPFNSMVSKWMVCYLNCQSQAWKVQFSFANLVSWGRQCSAKAIYATRQGLRTSR